MRAPWLLLVIGCASPPARLVTPTPTEAVAPAALEIRRGRPIVVDGAIGPDEWTDAATLAIETAPGWTVDVRWKHDGAALVFAFTNLAHAGKLRFPEVMLDVAGDRGPMLGPDDFWFHASFRDCWSAGKVNDYTSCVPEAAGWSANNFQREGAAPAVIELAIPLATIALPLADKVIGLAFDVTDTQETWRFWPRDAQLAIPATYGRATLIP